MGIVRLVKSRALSIIGALILTVLVGLTPLTTKGALHTLNWVNVKASYTPAPYPGNTLISGRDVIEVNSTTGDIIWIYTGKNETGLISKSNPLDADRLKSGNTLITYFHGVLTPQIDYPSESM